MLEVHIRVLWLDSSRYTVFLVAFKFCLKAPLPIDHSDPLLGNLPMLELPGIARHNAPRTLEWTLFGVPARALFVDETCLLKTPQKM
jgi:hypothetical protein